MIRSSIFKLVTLIVMTLLLSTDAQSQEKEDFKAQEPVLITAAGQSADALMVKVLSEKAGLDYVFEKVASSKDVDSVKSVIIVTGGSTKGLGAAKIDKEEEYKRVEELINGARKNQVPIITFHVGGKSRRGTLSDYFNQLAAENADYLAVVKGGDEDGFFAKIAKEKEIPMETPERIASIRQILEKIYNKGAGQSK